MSEYRARIDQVLVHLFNDILRIEEESLHRRGVHGLSMREIHVLQAIMESGEENTMSAVAARLHVTVGSLTVAINTLVRKGYVERQRSSQDKRCIHLLLTPRATDVNRLHQDFHRQLTDALLREIPQERLALICQGLDGVAAYFEEQERNGKL